MYLIEIAPPHLRGTIAGLYNTFYYVGSILATFTVYGTSRNLTGNITWRLPLWLQMVCPGIVSAFIWFCPESPRWLIGKKDSHAFFEEIISHLPQVKIDTRRLEASLRSIMPMATRSIPSSTSRWWR